MEEKPVKKSYKKMPRKKVCVFCQEKVEVIDYKDVNRLKKFITESGKMLPRRMSGTQVLTPQTPLASLQRAT